MHGGDVYRNTVKLDFSVNINPLGMPSHLKEILIESLDFLDVYPDLYCEQLKESLSKYYSIPSDYILCTNGASELIQCVCQSFDSSLLFAPCFSGYERALRKKRIVYAKRGEVLCLDAVSLVILTNPNNPDGYLYSLSQVEELAKQCRDQNVKLVVDECFMDLCDLNESFIPFLKNYPNVMVISAFTKSMAIPSLRLGFGMSSNKEWLEDIQERLPEWNVSTLAQIAGVYCASQKAFLEESRKVIQRERDFLEKELKKLGFQVYPSHTNFLLFQGKEDLSKILLNRKKILIRDCADYKGLKNGFYRIAVKKHEENSKLIQALKEICDE